MIKAIIFDLGNCLIGFDHRIAVRKILKYTKKPAEDIYNFFFDSPLTQDFERGKILPEEFFRAVKESLGLEITYTEFLPIWNEIFFPFPRMNELIASLPGLRLVMLSNINQLHYEYIQNNFAPLLNFFHWVIPSCATGFIKPQREIYDLAVASARVSLENIVYVDDRPDLIEAASSYGINSVQFQGAEELRAEFKKLKIISS